MLWRLYLLRNDLLLGISDVLLVFVFCISLFYASLKLTVLITDSDGELKSGIKHIIDLKLGKNHLSISVNFCFVVAVPKFLGSVIFEQI